MKYPDPCAMFGISAENYGVETQDVEFLGRLIEVHPEWTTVVEFGTYTGLTSLFIALMLQRTGGQLVTIDIADSRIESVRKARVTNIVQYTADLLEKPRNPSIEALIQRSAPCLVVMDNGDKIQEVNAYAPIIPVGSAFCVHDFGTTSKGPERTGEVSLADIRETIDGYGYVPVMHEEADAMKTRFRCWVRQ